MDNHEDYIVYCKTQNSYEIQKMIDMLKEVLDDAKFDFIRSPDQDEEIKKKLAKKNKSEKSNEQKKSNNSENSDEDKSDNSNNESSDEDNSENEDSEDEKPKKNKKNNKKVNKKVNKKNDNKKNTKNKKNKDSDDSDNSSNESDDDSDNESDDEKPKKIKNKKANTSNETNEDSKEDSKEEEKKKNPGGIRIVALDPHRTLLIYVKLNADEFDEFYVKTKTMYSIGLDLIQLHKFMKTVDKESIMTMKIAKDDDQYIKFELENTSKGHITYFDQKVLDIDDDPTKLPQGTNFEMSVAMDTSDFRKICQEMSQFSEYVEITCTAKEITFRCKGDITDFVKTFKHADNGSLRILCMNKENKKGLMMVQAIYNLKHLVTFGKCVNLCTEMRLFLKNDYPLFINYPIGNIGKMLVGLSPVDEKTIKRDADYDDATDKHYSSKKPVLKDV